MKKYLFRFVILLISIVLTVSGCNGTENDTDGDDQPRNITLQFATFWPAVDFQVEEGHKAWAKEISDRVEAETQHTLTFAWHYGGALLGATEIYEGVASGAADIGSTCPVYTVGIFPLTMGFELPGYNNDNALVASMAFQDAWENSEDLQKEYEDVKVMFFWATGPGDFLMTSPVRTMEDVDGKQIRAAGGSALAISALGGTPVSAPMSDAYVNLDSGIVNGLLGPTDTLKGFRLAEVTGYITKTPFVGYNVVFTKIMNIDTWNSLPASIQEIFEETNEKYIYEYGKLRTDHTILGQEYAVEEFGHEVIELDEAERVRWMEAIAHIPEDWAERTDNDGLPGSEILELFREMDQKYSDMYGDYGE